MFGRQATSRHHKGDKPFGKGESKPRADRRPLTRCEKGGFRGNEVGPGISGVRHHGWIFPGKKNFDNFGHEHEASKYAVGLKSLSDSDVSYREALWPSPWIYVAFFLEVPMLVLLLAPFSLTLGIVLALVIYACIALALTLNSPRIIISAEFLSVGKARIELKFVGTAAAFTGAAATRERGPNLDARAWTRFRAYVGPVVRITITDDDDATPYWLVSTRHPQAIVDALTTARAPQA